jgi:hypothetical protein
MPLLQTIIVDKENTIGPCHFSLKVVIIARNLTEHLKSWAQMRTLYSEAESS